MGWDGMAEHDDFEMWCAGCCVGGGLTPARQGMWRWAISNHCQVIQRTCRLFVPCCMHRQPFQLWSWQFCCLADCVPSGPHAQGCAPRAYLVGALSTVVGAGPASCCVRARECADTQSVPCLLSAAGAGFVVSTWRAAKFGMAAVVPPAAGALLSQRN